jgi:hypothetical protein
LTFPFRRNRILDFQAALMNACLNHGNPIETRSRQEQKPIPMQSILPCLKCSLVPKLCFGTHFREALLR